MPDFGRCRACNATIRWAVTRNGRAIPLDVDPAIDGNVELQGDDERLAVVVDPRSPPSRFRYKAHFATCPQKGKTSRAATRRAMARTLARARGLFP